MLTRLIKHSNLSKLRYCTSALYVAGDKATENYAVLTPHVDIEERFLDKDALRSNLQVRKLSIDLDKLEARWSFYMHLLDRKNILGQAKSGIGKEIALLMKEDETKNREEIEKYKGHLKVVKDEYWVLRNYLYGVEESAMLSALALPNVIHPKTPLENESVLLEHGTKPEHVSKSHIDLGTEKDLLDCTDNSSVYLKNSAALFEQAVLNYFQENLLESNFIQFSNSDFSKSVVVEGCGGDFTNSDEILSLDTGELTVNRLHLTGGASRYSFMAYFTKYSLQPSQLPLKLFASGRTYKPLNVTHQTSLLNAMQQSAIEICLITNEMNESFDAVVSTVAKLYKPLGHFRLVYLPPYELFNYESLRLSIQMYSNHRQEYVEVGCLSMCDDFLSKRLLMTYNDKKERKFPKMITGSILNVHKLLACKLENDDGLMCDVLEKHL